MNALKPIETAEQQYQWRKEVRAYYGHKCQNPFCVAQGQQRPLQIHHLKYPREHGQIIVPLYQVTVLCDWCHRIAELNKETLAKRYGSPKFHRLRQELHRDSQLWLNFGGSQQAQVQQCA